MPWSKGGTKPLSHLGCPNIFKLKGVFGDPWVAQRFGACLQPRACSWSPEIESHVRLPAWSLFLPLPVSLPLSVSLSLMNK